MKLQAYILDHLEKKRARPGDDLLSLLVQARREDGSGLTMQEMVGFAEQAIVGANETTQNGLAMAMCAMIEQAGLETQLRDEPKRIKTFIEECLRLHSPTAGMYRFATEDVELHGVRIPKGAAVHLRFAAANRDERHFPDPDKLDIERRNAGSHVAFSHATHHCLGAPLARLELNLSFQVLLSRRRNFRLARGDASYDYVPGLALRQMDYLWIESDAAQGTGQ
ncbi:MAG: cytochrome P450 [Pseudomonadales bacterium]